MSKARLFSKLIDSLGDIKLGYLNNVDLSTKYTNAR